MATKIKQSKTIVLPIEEGNYREFVKSRVIAHEIIQYFIEKYPEIFPSTIINRAIVYMEKTEYPKRWVFSLGD